MKHRYEVKIVNAQGNKRKKRYASPEHRTMVPCVPSAKNGRNIYLFSNRPKSSTSLSSGFISNFSLNNSVFNFGNYFGRSRSSSPQRVMNKQCMAVLDINACRWTMNHSVICNKNEIYQWNMFKSCFTFNYKEFPTRL